MGALRHTIEDPKIAIFFLTVFVIGVSSGIIENFAYVRLTEIGGNQNQIFYNHDIDLLLM